MRLEIELLFQRLLLGEPPSAFGRADTDLEHAFARARRILKSDVEEADLLHFELRLRLALHLAPVDAIKYNPRRAESRSQLISDFLQARHGRTPTEAGLLAVDVARVLWSWDEKRSTVTGYLHELLAAQGSRCANCKVEVSVNPDIQVARRPPKTLVSQDAFKPYYLSPVELLSPEVDHIEPVSRLGLNSKENLQVLCRLCNFGKGDRLGVNTRAEATASGDRVDQIPRMLRASMIYYVITRDGRKCSLCGSDSAELTVRKVYPEGGFLRSNLYAVCVECAV